jgi:hypothetical protein
MATPPGDAYRSVRRRGMSVEIQESEEPVTDRQLRQLEKRLGLALPPPYRRFLLRHNGGRPKPGVFRFGPADEPYSGSMVDRFLAVYGGKHDNFEHYFRTYKLDDRRIPENLIPVAHDPGGNLICLSVSGKDVGAVYFWDHEREEGPPREAVSLIAKSFDRFLAGLREPEDPRGASAVRDPFVACEKGDARALEAHLAKGVTVKAKNEYGRTLLEEAAMYGHVEVMRLLVQRGAVFADALMYAAQNGNVEATQYLLSAGASVNGRKASGEPLRAAAALGQVKAVEVLLAHGADVNVRPKKEPTTLRLAEAAGHERVVRLLKNAVKR